MLEKYIKGPFFFREGFEVFFPYKHEKNEKSSQKLDIYTNDHALDLDPKRNLRPMDAKGLISWLKKKIYIYIYIYRYILKIFLSIIKTKVAIKFPKKKKLFSRQKSAWR